MAEASAETKSVTTGKKREAEGKRERILAAALKLFGEKGLGETSIRDIAREANVNLGVIYYYFDDKEDLFRATMMESVLGSITGVLAEETNTRGTATERLERLYSRYLEFIDANPAESRIVLRGMLRVLDQEETPFVSLMMGRVESIGGIVRDGIENGEFADVDADQFGYAFLACMLMYFFVNLTAERFPGQGIEGVSSKEGLDFFSQTLVAGLKSGAGD